MDVSLFESEDEDEDERLTYTLKDGHGQNEDGRTYRSVQPRRESIRKREPYVLLS
jgi:hypothetical protein